MQTQDIVFFIFAGIGMGVTTVLIGAFIGKIIWWTLH